MTKRMKTARFHLIVLAGREVSHAHRLIIRLRAGARARQTFVVARQVIGAPACEPAGRNAMAIPAGQMSGRGPSPPGGRAAPCPGGGTVTHDGHTRSCRDATGVTVCD